MVDRRGSVKMSRTARLAEREALRIERRRVKAGLCRHCGGPLPCWSVYGDCRPGVLNQFPQAEGKDQ